MNIFLIQPGLSEAIVRSQLISVVNRLNNIKSQNYLLLHFTEKPTYGDENGKIIYYKNYLDEIRRYKHDIDVIYTRSYVIFLKLFIFKNISRSKIKILFDFRGLGSAETFARRNSKVKRYILEIVELLVYKNADSVHVVSSFLKDWLASKWGAREVTVIPCCVETTILREKSDVKSEMKFVYVGNTSFWQKIESIIYLYRSIESNRLGTSLTIITKDEEAVNKLLNENEILNFEVKSLSQEEVLLDLVNYDFGFLIRDNILMNNVASPVKFVEYISRGVIPIVTEGIGDYSSLVSENKLGIIIKNDLISIDELLSYYGDKNIQNRLFEHSSNYIWDAHVNSFFKS